MNVNEIKFRCSSSAQLMVEPKEKSPLQKYNEAVENHKKLCLDYAEISNKETKTAINKLAAILKATQLVNTTELQKDEVYLSESTKTHLVDVWVSNKYNRFTEINGKQLDKGNEVEEDGITTISRMTKKVWTKNAYTLENEFIKGTPDLHDGKVIILDSTDGIKWTVRAKTIRDAKCPYEIFSFNRSKKSDLKKLYYWQMQCYMALTGAQVAYVDFCLINTPYHILERELYYESKKHIEGDTPTWIELQIIANHVYDKKTFEEYMFKRGLYANDENAKAIILGFVEVPLNERYFNFKVERNDEDIARLYNRIIECRKWIKENLEGENNEN